MGLDGVLHVPVGSALRGGDVAVYVSDINQLSLPTPFHSALVSISVFMARSTVFHSANSPDNSPLSTLFFFRLYFCLIGPFGYFLLTKVSFSPDIILRG